MQMSYSLTWRLKVPFPKKKKPLFTAADFSCLAVFRNRKQFEQITSFSNVANERRDQGRAKFLTGGQKKNVKIAVLRDDDLRE